MSQKMNSILSYFSVTPQPSSQPRDSSCLKDVNANIQTPITYNGSKSGKVQPSTLGKRKVDAAAVIDLDSGGEEQGMRPAKRLSTVKALPASGRREQLQRALGDDSSKEAKEKDVKDRFSWLEGKQLRDGAGRKPTDPDFDARTVKIPSEVFSKLSESQKQYWSIKQKYRDVLLFMKIGSFYELYEDDAQIGHDILGWKMTLAGVGHCRQVGCAASGIDEAVAKLTAAGYKVGRVEQLETSAQAKAKRGPKAHVRRALTRIHTPATATGAVGADAVHLMALHEGMGGRFETSTQASEASFGFAFLDAAAGRFYVGSATDDAGRGNLGAILTQVAPKEVLYSRGNLSTTTLRKLASPPVPIQLSAVDAADFPCESTLDEFCSSSNSTALKEFLGSRLQLSESVLCLGGSALAALAALQAHLKRLKADGELATPAQMVVPYDMYEGVLRMDGATLTNLDLVETSDGGIKGSLLSCLDACASAGGRRLLRSWLCRPLRSISRINARLDAVEELASRPELVAEFRASLRQVGDLERTLGRVRNAAAAPQSGLPDWAIQAAQSRRLLALATAIQDVRSGIKALAVLSTPAEGASSAAALLQDIQHEVPRANAKESLGVIESNLDIPEQAARVSSAKAKGKQSGDSKVSLCKELIENGIAVQRMWSKAGKLGVEDIEAAHRQAAEIAGTNSLVNDFNKFAADWEALEGALSTVDVLCAFAAFSQTSDGGTCRPRFYEPGSGPSGGAVLDLRGLWHPSTVAGSGAGIIPNDLLLGTEGSEARSLLLTGPNMGGKSTLLRATCICVILAQIGCFVPADSATLTPADRLFTRLGAQDRIVAGESTFLVECNEAASILQHATPDSLVVLDELGRGTSTFDGYAIAHAVLQYLSSTVQPRLLFATHYHWLTEDFGSSPRVALGHMAAVVSSSSDASKCITFLYKLQQGACPQSYGLQVAQLAGIPREAVQAASAASARLEEKLKGTFSAARSVGMLTPLEASCVADVCKALGSQSQLEGGGLLKQLWTRAQLLLRGA